jgi:sugar phosphate isomerase/epimerase
MPVISLSTWSLFLTRSYREAMTFAVKHGFRGVELWSNPHDFWPRTVTAGDIGFIRSTAKAEGISLAIHFSYGSNNLGDVNEGHRRESVEQLKETLRLCGEIGGRIVVIHPGKIPSEFPIHDVDGLNPDFRADRLKEETVKRFKESLAEAARSGEDHHVVVGLENLGYNENAIQSRHEDIAAWVDEIGSPWLQVTVDVGHANLEEGVEKALSTLGPRIKHIH